MIKRFINHIEYKNKETNDNFEEQYIAILKKV